MARTTIIVPAYQEEKGLPVVLSKLASILKNGYEVLVIDDGSDDGTSDMARKFPVRLIKHEENRGKGEAIITGWKNAATDRVIFIDADDTYPVDIIPQMAQALEQYDMVVVYGGPDAKISPSSTGWGTSSSERQLGKYTVFSPMTP